MDAISVALLGNCTTDYIAKALTSACHSYRITAEVYNSPYNQYHQEIYNPGSGFYASHPELSILLLEGKSLFPEWFEFGKLTESREQKLLDIKAVFDTLTALVEEILKNSESKVIVHNFALPYFSPLGILDSKYYPGLRDMIALLNDRLAEWASDKDNVYIYDFNAFAACHGQAHLEDTKMLYATKTPIALRYNAALANEYMKYILPLTYRMKKCLVLDLDNTLWGGIAGEDGISGVKLDVAGNGRSFYDFQRELLNLYHKGVILAVNSKNNSEDALNILENHPHMVLKKDYFSVMKINWKNKAENMMEIAEELNIGLDSIAFFDDSAVERELIKSLLPDVTVIDVPADTSKYADTIRNMIEFERLKLTEEDLHRNAMYSANKKRAEARKISVSVADYLKSLGTQVTIEFSNSFTIPRIAQLTQKTNQFNMTTRRYTQEDITNLHQSPDHLVMSIRVADIYGDNGLTGVCIVKLDGENALIDTFLISCRIMGRNIEYAFLYKIVELLRKRGVIAINASYKKTEKNQPAKDFYRAAGFSAVSSDDSGVTYRLDESAHLGSVEDIEIVLKGETGNG